MTNRRSTKSALFTSVVAILLCCTMLLGTTFAWFTDTAVSEGNRIQAGNLDIDLQMWDGTEYVSIADGSGDIFKAADVAQNSTATLWEPGKTQVAYLAIKNNGNLAAKYQVQLNAYADEANTDNTIDMAPAMRYAITNDATNANPVTQWNNANAISVTSGLNPTSADGVSIAAGATHNFALSVHMDENAGNEYQGASILFDLVVNATQDTVEEDATGNQYDKDANALTSATVVSAPEYVNKQIPWRTDIGNASAEQKLEAAYVFTTPHTSATVGDCEYKDWLCDFYVSVDRDVPDGAIFLGGSYGTWGWIGFSNEGLPVEADKEIPLLGLAVSGGSTDGTTNWKYEDIVNLVSEFTCGVARTHGYAEDPLNGATFTVKLCLINPETNMRTTVNTVTYTFE